MRNFKIVIVDYKYCDYLRKFDSRVCYNRGSKKLRPFIGVLFQVDKYKYFAPLSSPKEKHKKMKNTIDFVKIDNGNLGAVNFNNMIPVQDNNYKLIDLNTQPQNEKEAKYKKLLKNQLLWLNKNQQSIRGKAIKLYKNHKNGKLPQHIMNRCCNFSLLEEKCVDYSLK